MPFTIPALAAMRMQRDARHRLVLLTPNPSSGRGAYVVP